MSTAHEVGARDALMRLLSRPGGGELLSIAENSVQMGKWDREFLDAVGYGGRMRLEQLFITAWMHNKLITGELFTIKVRAASAPHMDRFREENMDAVRDLPEPFYAEVDVSQNCADSDGDLWWTEPVVGSQTVWPDDDHNEGQSVLIRPFKVPLEVGSTKPSRTSLHIREGRGVARWPYGTDWITIFVAPDGVSKGFSESLVRPAKMGV